WSTAGDYTVRCIVSDRRGGVSVQNVSIHVGSPVDFRIAGRITKADGTPVPGVLVKDSDTALSTTDADGRYMLGRLASGSHTITALHDGWTLAAGFTNPLVVGPSVTTADFTATAPTGGGGGITIEHWDGITGSLVSDLTSNARYPANPD